ncbi:MAG: oligosaccharide flippase family protein [Ruminococcus sp.]|nr:oligosaccharide flippase family protein [Ruminococcus sp.]
MNRNSNFVKNTLILSIGTFLPKAAAFFTLPVLTGYLTKEEYGTYDIITILVSLLLPAVTLQIQTAAFRFLLEHKEDEEYKKKIITNIFSLTVPVSVITLIILYFILHNTSVMIRLCMCIYYFSDILFHTTIQISRGIGNNLNYSVSAIINAVGKMVFVIILVKFLKMGLSGAVIALCVSTTLAFVYIAWKIRLHHYIDRKLIDGSCIKEMIKYSWPIVPNELSLWVMNASDRMIVKEVMGIAYTGVLAASTKIPSLINLAQNAMVLAWQENASITANDEDASKYYSDMFKVMTNLQMGVYSIVVASTPILFRILIKGEYSEAYYQIPVLCLSIYFSGLATFLGGIYVGKKATKSIAYTTISAAVINIVIDLLTIHHIGLYAASISTLISYIALFSFRIFDVQRLVKVKCEIKLLVIQLVIMLIEMILCYQQTLICNIINGVIAVMAILIFNRPLLKGCIKALKKILHVN